MKINVSDYYGEHYNEGLRHKDAFGIIQELRTIEMISRYLTKDKMTILDIGGANGVYSFPLADLGHDVSILDITPKHIDEVKRLNDKRNNKLKNMIVGDARDYKLPETYDMIIIHGPLYHVLKREQRVAILKKAKEHLKPGGVILGFGINRYAGYFYGISSGNILDSKYKSTVFNEIKTGIRTTDPGWYFHTSKELESEFKDSGIDIITTKSVTSQIWMLPNIKDLLNDKKELQNIMDMASLAEDETAIGQDLVCIGN